MYKIIERIYSDEEGQGLVEYGMILLFVVIILVSILTTIGHTLNDKYEMINSQMP